MLHSNCQIVRHPIIFHIHIHHYHYHGSIRTLWLCQRIVHLQKIIKDYAGVVIDFWSPTCPPCMRFKPIFESAARGNPNKNIVFCSAQHDQKRETAQAFQVQAIPQFNFFLNGEQSAMFKGANEK